MNIQQYMTPEVVGPLTFISILFVAFLSSIQIAKISKLTEYHEDEDEEDYSYKPKEEKPNSGQIWYSRMSNRCPWPVMDANPVKVTEVRGDWLQHLDGEVLTTMRVKDFCDLYMKDEFDDFAEKEEVANKDERLEDLGFNVIKIHGEDFVLEPVKKAINE